ncbi:hypothetical protein [Streptomyces sp. NBC_01618]|nr:hypothetical protein OH735_23630 [Streptomyces sp. NBC_01618]
MPGYSGTMHDCVAGLGPAGRNLVRLLAVPRGERARRAVREHGSPQV